MTKINRVLFSGHLTAGQTSDPVTAGGYVAAHLAFSGSLDLAVEVEGAIGTEAGTFTPEESDWKVVSTANSSSIAEIWSLTTLIRFRVITGTLRRVAAMLYSENSRPPQAVSMAGIVKDSDLSPLRDATQQLTLDTAKALDLAGVTQTSRNGLASGTLSTGTALRLFAEGNAFDILPNAQAGPVDNAMVFQLGGGKRARRNISATGEITTGMFNVPTDGSDAAPTLQAAIDYAIANNLNLRPLPGTYTVNSELVVDGVLNMTGEGNGWIASVNIKAGVAGMRSVMVVQGQFCHFRGIVLDADKKADYALLEKGAIYSTFDSCGFRNGVLDSHHRSATTLAGGIANNDGTEYYNCVWLYAGKVFGSPAMLARPEYNTEWTLANQRVTVAGTITLAANGTTVVGTGTDFTAMRIRRGDLIRLGDGWADAVPCTPLEILSVDSATQLTLAEPSPRAFTNAAFAVHVGDNWHEEDALDNNVSRIYGGFCWGAACSGHFWFEVYGNTIFATAIDYNLGFAVRLGRRSFEHYNFYATLFNPYFENNFFGTLDAGRSIHFRMFGGQDGAGPGHGPLVRWSKVPGNVRNGIIQGTGYEFTQHFGTVYPITSSGLTLPRSKHADNGDLDSVAYRANTFPIGLSFTAINGATNVPGGFNLGVLQTVIDPTYIGDGGGFGYQMFAPAAGGGQGRIWVRHGFGIAPDQAWGPWRVMSLIQQAPPAVVSTAALNVSNPPTQAEIQAIAQRANEAATAANALRAAGIAAGWLTA